MDQPLPAQQIAVVDVGIEKGQHVQLLAGLAQLTRHLVRNQTAKGIAR